MRPSGPAPPGTALESGPPARTGPPVEDAPTRATGHPDHAARTRTSAPGPPPPGAPTHPEPPSSPETPGPRTGPDRPPGRPRSALWSGQALVPPSTLTHMEEHRDLVIEVLDQIAHRLDGFQPETPHGRDLAGIVRSITEGIATPLVEDRLQEHIFDALDKLDPDPANPGLFTPPEEEIIEALPDRIVTDAARRGIPIFGEPEKEPPTPDHP